MNQKIPAEGDFYRHFQGSVCQIRQMARDSETGREVVVYQEMQPPFQVWACPLESFLMPVDREKYPKSSQKFRFQPVSIRKPEPAGSRKVPGAGRQEGKLPKEEAIAGLDLKKVFLSGQPEKYLSGKLSAGQIAQEGFMALLDARTYREKRQIYIGLRQYLDQRLLSNIAVALDIVLEEGSQEEQYETILHCLETFEKYEAGGRLRG